MLRSFNVLEDNRQSKKKAGQLSRFLQRIFNKRRLSFAAVFSSS
jgi:hypothetical protein